MENTTSKKVKYIGQQEFINAQTGEIESFCVTSIEERDFNFHKIWMRNFITTLDIVGNQKTKLCMWLIDNINRDNQLIGTLRDIATRSGISLETVRITIKLLLDADFMRKVQNGVYVINPDIIFKGTRAARLNILNQYRAAEEIKMTDEEQLLHLRDSIKQLSERAEAIEKRIATKNSQSESPDAIAFQPLKEAAI